MIRASVVTLIKDLRQPAGVFDTPEPETRTVPCTVRSASYRMRFEAQAHGFDPAVILRLSDEREYDGEARCEFEGKEYLIDETPYRLSTGEIELTLMRRGREP